MPNYDAAEPESWKDLKGTMGTWWPHCVKRNDATVIHSEES